MMLNFKTIKNKILILFFAESIIIAGLLIVLSQLYSTKIMLKNVDDNAVTMVNSFEKQISSWLLERKEEIENLTLIPEISEMNWEKAEPLLRKLAEKRKDTYVFFFMADLNGDYDTTITRHAGNISDRPYFHTVLQGETVISDPVISKSTGKQICVAAAPIRDKNGTIKGILAGTMELNTLHNWIGNFNLKGTDSYSFIIDKFGTVITHPDPEFIMKMNLFDILRNLGIIRADEMFNTASGKISYRYDKVDSFAYFHSIEGSDGWKFVTKIPKNYLYTPIYNMRTVLVVTMILCTILSSLAGLWLAKTVSSPIIALKNIFERGLSGDTEARFAIKHHDELGEAANYFNLLMDRNNKLVHEIVEKGKELEEYIDHLITYNGKIHTDGTILIVNETLAEKIGLPKEKIIGKKIWNIEWFSHTENAAQRMKENLRNTNTGETIKCEEIIKKGEYGFTAIEYMLRPVKSDKGKTIFIVLEARDVTEKMLLESELLNVKKLESIGILAGGIAHDFNNIMTGILGMLSLAKYYTKAGDNIYDKLETAEKATLKAKDLTQQLLTFSKGGFPLKKTMSIKNVISEAADFVLRGSNIKSDIFIAQDLLPADIDEGQMNQVFTNIIINARQAMPGGGSISILVENFSNEDRLNPLLERKKYIKIIISDTGVGIPEEIQKKIFDPYFSTKKDGVGLGLATSYSIIKKHDGYISVESSPGVGTSFIIFIPASLKPEQAIDAEKEHAVISEPTLPVKSSDSSSKKILIMDDDEIILKVAAGILRYYGYEVATSSDGFEAVQKISDAKERANAFDLVILDLTVPGGSGGKEVIGKIKEIAPKIRTIVSSGYSNDPVIAEYTKYGFDGVVSKPYVANDLISAVKSLLE